MRMSPSLGMLGISNIFYTPAKDRHRWVVSSIAREEGVDCDVPPFALFEETYTHKSLIEVFLRHKELFDQAQAL